MVSVSLSTHGRLPDTCRELRRQQVLAAFEGANDEPGMHLDPSRQLGCSDRYDFSVLQPSPSRLALPARLVSI